MPKIGADGAGIHVEIEGPQGAPPLMLSNSLGTSLHIWDRQAKALAKNFRLIRYDQRGHGKSGAPAGVYSIERLALDAVAVLDALKIARVNFCGLSMGGMTGMWLARFYPERLSRLVLANTAAKSQTPQNWNTRITTVKAKGLEAVADTVMNIWFSGEFRAREPERVAAMRGMLVATDAAGYVGCCGAIRDMDQRWGVSGIRAPTLVICGTRDMATPPKDSDHLQAAIPGAKLVTLDAGHISNVERADEFTAALENFLQ